MANRLDFSHDKVDPVIPVFIQEIRARTWLLTFKKWKQCKSFCKSIKIRGKIHNNKYSIYEHMLYAFHITFNKIYFLIQKKWRL